MAGRKMFLADAGSDFRPFDGVDRQARAVSPILAGGDILGGVVLLQPEGDPGPCEKGDMKLVTLASGFIARQMEE